MNTITLPQSGRGFLPRASGSESLYDYGGADKHHAIKT